MERTKYNVDKDCSQRSFNGICFDSNLEMRYYRDVILPKAESGEIAHYELQKSYTLQPNFTHNGETIRAIVYVADFYIEYKDGSVEVIDTKGCPDSVAKIKQKMFLYQYPNITYRWICYSKIDGNETNGGWCDYKYVQQQRAVRRKQKRDKDSAKK